MIDKISCIENAKIDIDKYKNIYHQNIKLFNELKKICIKIGEPVEGNCITLDGNINIDIPRLITKQMNHFILGSISDNIMEIGFNAGHSCLLYLLSNPSSKVTIFDICSHKYTMPCFNYLQQKFPNRLQIFPGDSTVTIPKYIKLNPNDKFDLIHIDGCHKIEVATQDFYNSLKIASNIIIWDDTQVKKLNDLLNVFIGEDLVQEILCLYRTKKYKHRICHIKIK